MNTLTFEQRRIVQQHIEEQTKKFDQAVQESLNQERRFVKAGRRRKKNLEIRENKENGDIRQDFKSVITYKLCLAFRFEVYLIVTN